MNKIKLPSKFKGFTLIELLIALTIISILAIVVLVALKPAQRLSDARDARRAQDINQILTGVSQCVIDKKDSANMNICLGTHAVDTTYEIVSGAIISGCQTLCASASADTSCLNLSTTLTDYFIDLPSDPSGVAVGHTGYSVTQRTNGMVVIEACAAENSVIKVSR